MIFYSSRLQAVCFLSLATGANMCLADSLLDYNRDVRPILSDKCFYCHGPDSQHREADLRLDIEAFAKEHSIVPGSPEDSEVVSRVFTNDPDRLMPPPDSGKKLTIEEVSIIRRWVSEGAVYDDYWAYEAPKSHSVPNVNDKAWPKNPIDHFVLSRLDREQLKPSKDADRITLARRLSFDLTGLPPVMQAVDEFVADKSEDAYSRYVDRLLSSPNYGERMATYWLDLVRYADTVGYHGDQDHSISPYRDYVIDAMNESMPLDRFSREQLAGDLLPESGIRQQVASGYNRLLQTTHEGGLQRKEYLAIYAADRVRNLSGVWLGATLGCAQCHDHKYDPYTIKDFYSMVAFFADVDESQHFDVGTNSLPTKRPPEIVLLDDEHQQIVDTLQAEIASLSADQSDEVKKRIKALTAEVDAIREKGRRTMVTMAVEPREIRVLPRGNWLDESGPIVAPAVPEFMGKIEATGERPNRLDLANWLHDREGGVGGQTARVMANRLWYLMFGVGISRSLDDFGGQGQPPEHPELLDYLALQLLEHDWDLKQLIRQIVMSRTYRQSAVASKEMSQRDPYNQLFARQSKHRLPAETIRDSALLVSGLLVDQQGGDSVKPYQPEGYYRHLNFPNRRYIQDQGHRQWRRGLYVHWQRQFLHPMLKAFDAPSREECIAERPRSNNPLAALALLNDQSFVEAALAFAGEVIQSGGEKDNAKLSFAFEKALSRKPDPVEQKILVSLLNENREAFRIDSESVAKLLGTGTTLLRPNADLTELAAWTMVTRAILNMDEAITRN